MNLREELERRITAALTAAGLKIAPAGQGELPPTPAMVGTTDAKFGDYKASGVMGAAKRLKVKPRDLAEKVVANLQAGRPGDLSDLAGKIEIAGPGFINIKLKDQWVAAAVVEIAAEASAADLSGDEPRLGVPCPAGETPAVHAGKMPATHEGGTPSPHAGGTPATQTKRQTIVVDYSAPNLAKEMHVGHLRSTIIGDALARTLEFQGHNVIRQNHVGDWGTQFGMLTAYLNLLIYQKETQTGADVAPYEIGDLEKFYREAKTVFDTDPDFAKESRECVVVLQSGASDDLRATKMRDMWRRFLNLSMAHCRHVYQRLGVSLTSADVRGESAYNDDLPHVIADLDKAGLLTESQGAMCVFLPQFTAKDGTPLPLIVQKSDEGYLYATTDLAAIRYRVNVLHADRVLYVVDARQSLHFQMVFATARAAGFAPENVSLEHIAFGTMMGADGKPFRTRDGETVKLMDLLGEAVDKARQLVEKKNAEDVEKGRTAPLTEEQKNQIAEAVGIGAVKYADLAQNRNSDYLFSWDKMLALDGNTAPYMQYAYARIRSIFRKDVASAAGGLAAGASGIAQPGAAVPREIGIEHPAERALAVRLIQFPETIATVAADCLPSVLCAYLYDLAGAFTTFYENCPVLKSDQPTRSSRLALCDLTARVIKKALELLGIGVIDQM